MNLLHLMMNMYVMLMLMLWNVNACLTPRGVTSSTPQGWILVKFVENLKFSPLGHWFCPWGKLHKERHRIFVPCTHRFLLFIEPLFHLPRKGEGKQTELDASWCDVFDDDSVT
jgi:hypothetical protein